MEDASVMMTVKFSRYNKKLYVVDLYSRTGSVHRPMAGQKHRERSSHAWPSS